jgi:hypothetical protein
MTDFTVIKDNQKDRLKSLVDEIKNIQKKGWLGFEEMAELEILEKELFKIIKEL